LIAIKVNLVNFKTGITEMVDAEDQIGYLSGSVGVNFYTCAKFGEAATNSPGDIEGFGNSHLVTFDPKDLDLFQTGHLSDRPGDTFCMRVKLCKATAKSPRYIEGSVNSHLVIFDLSPI
jgi:hypothetical protein